MKPLKRFPLSSKSQEIELGILPNNLLSLISKVNRYEELRKSLGINPVNMFPCKCRCFKYSMLFKEGRDPERAF